MSWLQNKSKSFFIITWIPFVLLFLYYRFFEISRPLWGDELITIKTLSSNPFLNPFYSGISTNLPLYYYLLKFFEIITANFLNLRILNIVLAALTIIFVAKKYNFINYFQKLTLILFLALSPIQIYYSIELRTYLLAQFLILINYYYFTKKDFNLFFWITAIALLFTHYACYIYLFGIFLYLLIKRNLNLNLILRFALLGLIGFATLIMISKNPGFSDSTASSALSGNFSRLTLNNLLENILKLREVITIYYNFGLHYYRLENSFLSIFKKFIQILFLVYGIFVIFRNKKISDFESQNLIIFILLMLGSIFADLMGIMPFGGRHIFPFHFLYLLILATIISKIYEANKAISYFILGIILSTYLLYNTCLSFNLKDFVGNNDPQGVLISKCINK